MKQSQADIIREYGPFSGVSRIDGLTYDGQRVWFASRDKLNALDPASGQITGTIALPANAGVAFDGRNLFQIVDDRINKVDPDTGRILASIPAPGGMESSGLAWADGVLWVGDYEGRKIRQVDPETGAVLRTIESDRYVTGVTWADREIWHGTWEGDDADLRRIDSQTGDVLETVQMPAGLGVSGLEFDGVDRFYCGGGGSGVVRAVRKPA